MQQIASYDEIPLQCTATTEYSSFQKYIPKRIGTFESHITDPSTQNTKNKPSSFHENKSEK
jgi:hypothetical protein